MSEAEVLAHDLAERRKRKAVERGWMFLSIGVSFILMAFVFRSVTRWQLLVVWMFPAAAALLGIGVAQFARGQKRATSCVILSFAKT